MPGGDRHSSVQPVCFKCGKDLHSDDCPFARLRAELNDLKESEDE